MIALLDTSEDLPVVQAELGGIEVGQLLTPLTRRTLHDGYVFAIDNGSYARFEEGGFVSLVERELPHRDRCKFVAVPDVVASARRTMELWNRWRDRGCLQGWPLAMVMQDGIEDMEIPWEDLSAIFIGGSTDWKLSTHAEACVRAAKMLGKLVHVGRCNTHQRVDKFEGLGADTWDGTGVSRYSKMRAKMSHPTLFGGTLATPAAADGQVVSVS